MRERSVIRIGLNRVSAIALAAAMAGFGFSVPAAATDIPITFDFNNSGGYTFANGYSSTSISSYMRSVLINSGLFDNSTITAANVYVTGAVGQMGSSAYNGEGFTVGCTSSFSGCVNPGTGVTNLTLGNTEQSTSGNHDATKFDTTAAAANDGFLKNCTGSGDAGGCSANSSDIFMSFKNLKTKSGQTVNIANISFDLQIFPDGTCTDDTAAACGGAGLPNLPDLELWSKDDGTGTKFAEWTGVAPGVGGTFTRSDVLNPETAPQLLTTSGTICIACSTTTQTIDFMDWPATIGLDHIVASFSTPEPSTFGMLAFGLLGLAWIGWRRRKHGTSAIDVVPTA